MKIEVLEEGVFYRIWAPAKVNLFFETTGIRPDGYHDIETLTALVDVCDRLDCRFEKTETPGIVVECFDEHGGRRNDIPEDQSNLVSIAYNAYFKKLKETLCYDAKIGLKVKIFKKISTKAGLGGGSSDASCILRLISMYCGCHLRGSELALLAGAVGSDVPLFLIDGASVGRGRGELVEAFDLPNLWMVIVKPCMGLATPDVYRESDRVLGSARRSLDDVLDAIRSYRGDDFASFMSGLIFNRLEEAASRLWDGVERWKKTLNALPSTLGAQMTGSGSAFFALCRDENAAQRAADEIRAIAENDITGQFRIEDVFIAKTLSREDCRGDAIRR